MKSYNSLPDGYKEIFNVDIQKNKKVSFIVNGLSILIMLFMLFITFLNGYWIYFFAIIDLYKLIAFFALMVLYIVLHELTHGIAMKICGTNKIKYGFTGLYGYAGSDDFYDKKTYDKLKLKYDEVFEEYNKLASEDEQIMVDQMVVSVTNILENL